MSEDREHRIRVRAFELWEEQGRPEDRDVDLWLIAENEIDAAAEPVEPPNTALPDPLLAAHSVN